MANLIFNEDFETFTECVGDRSYGTYYQEYRDKFLLNNFQSDESCTGQHSLTTDLFKSASGRTIGVLTNIGNTSRFNLRESGIGTKAYFKWIQKYETDINWGGYLSKQLYVNYRDQGDFVLTLSRLGPQAWLLSIISQNPYGYTYNKYFPTSKNLDDNLWHTFEVFMDWTPTECTCGSEFADCTSTGVFWLKIDGQIERIENEICYRKTPTPGPGLVQVGWPSNRSGTGGTGTAMTWLDSMEIWDDIPDADETNSVKKILDYDFEDWGGSIDSTPGYIYTSGYSEYCTEHAEATTVVEEYNGWHPLTGSKFMLQSCSSEYPLNPPVDGITRGHVQPANNIGAGEDMCGDGSVYLSRDITTGEIYTTFRARFNKGFKTIADGGRCKWIVMNTDGNGSIFMHLGYNGNGDSARMFFYHGDEGLWLGETVDLNNAYDGEWHKFSFYIDFNNGIIRAWFDVENETTENTTKEWIAEDGQIGSCTKVNHMKIQGNFSAKHPTEMTYYALDRIQIWDGIPGDEETMKYTTRITVDSEVTETRIVVPDAVGMVSLEYVDTADAPKAGCSVTLTRVDDTNDMTTGTTGDNGVVVFEGLAYGEYEATIEY